MRPVLLWCAVVALYTKRAIAKGKVATNADAFARGVQRNFLTQCGERIERLLAVDPPLRPKRIVDILEATPRPAVSA